MQAARRKASRVRVPRWVSLIHYQIKVLFHNMVYMLLEFSHGKYRITMRIHSSHHITPSKSDQYAASTPWRAQSPPSAVRSGSALRSAPEPNGAWSS